MSLVLIKVFVYPVATVILENFAKNSITSVFKYPGQVMLVKFLFDSISIVLVDNPIIIN